MAKPLVVTLSDPATGARFVQVFDEGPILVGRGDDVGIVIDRESVSAHHGTLSFDDETITYVDLDSHNGTLLDGQPLDEWPLETLRRAIGFVPQDTFLFSETLRENIAFGVENPAPGQVEEAAMIASIAGDVADFPSGYDTLDGERGLTLSGGQKQRTALARAIIRDPQILILDDALSSVDTETELLIQEALARLMKNRTSLIIAHRLSTIQHANRIIVMHKGCLREMGTHEELLAQRGIYFRLYQLQFALQAKMEQKLAG